MPDGALQSLPPHLLLDAGQRWLVRRYAALRGTSFTEAVRIAVGEALRREGETENEAERRRRLLALQDRVAAWPSDPRTDDEILGYDENGLPT